jgi:hypothetical protein
MTNSYLMYDELDASEYKPVAKRGRMGVEGH